MHWATPFALLGILALSIPLGVEAAPTEKVAVCHYNADLDPGAPTWERLEIRGNVKNVEAHLRHGDAFPGNPVPGTDGALVFDATCTPTPIVKLDVCVYREQLRDSGIEASKPVALTLRLGTELSTVFTNDQNGKLDVGPILAPYSAADVYVRFSNNSNPDVTGEAYFEGIVPFEENLTGFANLAGRVEFAADTHVHLFNSSNGALLQTIKFHTSCSAPLVIGSQFGTVSLTGAGLVNKGTGEFIQLP